MDKAMIQIAGYLWSQSWQIALLAAAIAVVNWMLRGRSAHVRYLLWLLVVAKCVMPPLFGVTVPILPRDQPGAFSVPMEQSGDVAAGQTSLQERDKAGGEEPTVSPGGVHAARRLLPIISGRAAIAMAWLAGLTVFLTAASIKAGRMTR